MAVKMSTSKVKVEMRSLSEMMMETKRPTVANERACSLKTRTPVELDGSWFRDIDSSASHEGSVLTVRPQGSCGILKYLHETKEQAQGGLL